ncbi:PAS domain S-box-containing protein [Natronoarchaeum philippinense]|uniref:histidine kinase n=1 Tax=Natronoarchaeum philippinense TaxID=558529 RepID=A0A285N2Y1_NATPI|nr:PAS domain S-box protein [Natronoarchaeum philippinense]SNZ03789.1 PAS domain S-box-containing protein [Natronoarchaeum philippinense]
MTDSALVLCLSIDPDAAERLAAPLEWSYPRITVIGTADPDEAIDRIEDDAVDCVVTDRQTLNDRSDLLPAVRRHHPEITLLVQSPYETGSSEATALAEVVDFLDSPDDDAFGGWVANSVVCGAGDGGPPGGNQPEDLVRDVRHGLVDATSPMDVEDAVCDQLTKGGRYTFAWVGEYDPGERQVIPWVTSAATADWPTARTFGIRPGSAETVLERTLRAREIQWVEDVENHSESVPWRDAAVERGCTAAAFLPLAVDGELRGILGVYTDAPSGFSEAERSALEEVGEATGHVLDTMAIRGEFDQQERALRRYERLVETVGDGMYALDANGHFMTVNNGLLEMTGYSREGLLGEHVSILLDDDDVERQREAIDRLGDDDREKEAVEITVYRKDGTGIPCENQIALLPKSDERRGTVGVIRDITERKKRERELERQNERLEAFASIVSHDLRNPLSVAQGYIDIVGERAGEIDALRNVRDALDRMETIIGDVLALARHGQTVTETEQLTLRTTVEDAWGNVSTPEAELVIESSGAIAADRSRLLRMLENLFRNALEHGAEDVTIKVGLLDAADEDAAPADASDSSSDSSQQDATARSTGFYVEDDGPGMPAEIREHAFESSFTTSEEGLGIGLWVVREVASAHGWTIEATESASGGARFEFGDVRERPE